MNLFAYGTLMDTEIMAGVSDCRPAQHTACLSDYRRLSVSGEVYPALVEETAGRVAGVLYTGLPESAWPRLDRFEGEIYQRISITVVDREGWLHPAETYLCKPEFRHLLADSDWSFEKFLESGKRLFAEEYRGFEAIIKLLRPCNSG